MFTFIIIVIILVFVVGALSESSNSNQSTLATSRTVRSTSKRPSTVKAVRTTFRECPKCGAKNLVENLDSSSTCDECNWRLLENNISKKAPIPVTTAVTQKNPVATRMERSTSKRHSTIEVHTTVKNCPKCGARNLVENLNSISTCNECKWRLVENYIPKEANWPTQTNWSKQNTNSPVIESSKVVPNEKAGKTGNTTKETIRLSGVTHEGRQGIISEMRTSDKIQMRRDKYNEHDKNAIGVYNSQNQNIGWIPRERAAVLAPSIDSGTKYDIKINKILGGNGYNYGLEVLITKNENTGKSNEDQKNNSKAVKAPTDNKYSRLPNNSSRKQPEYIYVDSVLARVADQESLKEVHNVLADFIKYRDKTLPFLNRENIEHLVMADLEALFDNTIMLAAGTESNFIHKHYKTILIQLSFQLGFLTHRLLPGSSYAKYAESKMNWLSTMDVRLETKILQPFFNKSVKVTGTSPVIADTTVSDQIAFWDIDEIAYVLSNLNELGYEFKKFIEKY